MTLTVLLAHVLAVTVLLMVAAGLLAILPTAGVYVCAAVGIAVMLRYGVRTVTRLVRIQGATR